MFSLYRTLSLRYLGQRWFRATLVVFSIALGVAMLVATQALNTVIARAGQGAVNPLGGLADLQITNDEAGVPTSLLEQLRKTPVPGVLEIMPILVDRVALPKLKAGVATLIGGEMQAVDRADSRWKVRRRGDTGEVEALVVIVRGQTPVMVGSELSKELSGGRAEFTIRAAGKEHLVVKLDTLEAQGAAAVLAGNTIFMELRTAASILGRPNLVTRLDLFLEPGVDRQKVRAALEERLAGLALVRRPEEGENSYRDVLAGLEVGFKMGGFIALVVGLFLVYNALSVSVAERRHDIGIMRSLGATRFQIGRLFVTEATILGLAGAAIGVPLGWGLASVALGPIQDAIGDIFLPLEARTVEISRVLILVAVAAGVATAILAALVPAIQAASEEPADAVRRAPPSLGLVFFVVQIASTIVILSTGVGFMSLSKHLPDRVGTYGGIALVLLGALISAPLLSTVVARLLGPLVRHFVGLEGRLAADNLARSPGRTGLVIAALAAVVALLLQTAGLTLSSERAILAWIDDAMAADLFVTANSPVTSSGKSLPMKEELGNEIAKLDGVEHVLPVRFKRFQFQEKLIFLTAFDAKRAHDIDRRRADVPGLHLYPRLEEPGKVLVSENFAALYNLREGDRFSLQSQKGPVELHVLGMVVDYSWNRGTVLMDRKQYLQHFQDDLVDVFDVYCPHSATAEQREEVRATISRRWGADQGLIVVTRQELRQQIAEMIQRLYSVAYAQEGVVGFVSALGIVTALVISVLQRRREIGLLRAVGATQPQIMRSVLAEAVLMGIIGSLIGLALGLPLEYYVVKVILLEDAGFVFPMHVPWLALSLIVGSALVVAILAGLGPALHAMRMRIAEAIAYE